MSIYILPYKGIKSELMISDEEIQSHILHKLFRKKKFGGAHISYEKIKRWISGKIQGNGKRVDENLKSLIKEGIVLSKPTSYGLEISLNPKFSEEIISRIRRFYPQN